jgi:peptidylprolyl isomerase/peptidyl-prolyl cis-trans isomerase A (cyclophilin A)
MNRPTLLVLAALALTHAPAALAQAAPDLKARPPKADPRALYAVFETSRGKIGVQLLPGEAPKAVSNFVELATGKKEFKDPIAGTSRKAAYFDGTLFHRVIPGFMIQGGDPTTRDQPLGADKGPSGVPFGIYGPGYKFEDELPAPGTRLFDRPCVLAMANSGPNTNGSQFFITEGFGPAVPQLEPRPCGSPSGVCGYTRFGVGVCGCELVGPIARAGNSKTRLVKVTIQSAPPTCK